MKLMASQAHSFVAQALKDGELLRPGSCSECGGKCQPEAHHDDYSRPLDVRWLCRKCHRAFHRKHGSVQEGREPDKWAAVLLRIPSKLYEELSKQAEQERRSINAQVLIALEQHLRGTKR